MDRRAVNERVIAGFRAGGSMGGMPRDRMLLLTTTGRVSGERRTAPMMSVRVGDRLVVVASDSGARRHPHWYRNLVADPRVHVELGDGEFDARARVLTGSERADAWAEVVRQIPMYAQHQASTDREIPLVELVRAP